jgi:hypothetical protein
MRYSLITFLIICFSQWGFAQSNKNKASSKKASPIAQLFQGKKSVYTEFGFSANLLLSDLSNQVSGLGIGNQYSLGVNFNTEAKRGFKSLLQFVKAKENNFRESKVDTSGSTYYRSFEQEWSMIGFGVETRNSNRLVNWYWDALLGYAFGQKSRIQTQDEGIDASLVNSEEPTRSFFYLSLGAGVRKALNKKWTLAGNFRSYALLGSIYGDSLKSKTLILVPMMANIGLEYQF